MVAFCDIVIERAQEAAKQFGAEGAKVYTDYKELLKDASIDAVHICPPNRSHSFITVNALEAGTHALDLTLWVMSNCKPKCCVGTTYHALNTTEVREAVTCVCGTKAGASLLSLIVECYVLFTSAQTNQKKRGQKRKND